MVMWLVRYSNFSLIHLCAIQYLSDFIVLNDRFQEAQAGYLLKNRLLFFKKDFYQCHIHVRCIPSIFKWDKKTYLSVLWWHVKKMRFKVQLSSALIFYKWIKTCFLLLIISNSIEYSNEKQLEAWSEARFYALSWYEENPVDNQSIEHW